MNVYQIETEGTYEEIYYISHCSSTDQKMLIQEIIECDEMPTLTENYTINGRSFVATTMFVEPDVIENTFRVRVCYLRSSP